MMKHLAAVCLAALLSVIPGQADAGNPPQCKASCLNACTGGTVCDITGECMVPCNKYCPQGDLCYAPGACMPCTMYLSVPSLEFVCSTVDDNGTAPVVKLGSNSGLDCLHTITDESGAKLAAGPCNGSWNAPDKTALYKIALVHNSATVVREACVGPDLVVRSFDVDIKGALVTYRATVCNIGSRPGQKFRVGFWHDRATEPASSEMGDVFKGILTMAPQTYCPAPKLPIQEPDPRPIQAAACEEVIVSGGLRPNGSFKAWCRVDSGDFVVECREGNNGIAPIPYNLSNPDLDLASFKATVAGSSVTYDVTVCNRGTAGVSKFYLDVYYHRPKQPPIIGEPGDVVKPVFTLAAGACTSLTFQRPGAPNGLYQAYAFADPDDFISEPNEANNLSKPLQVQVGGGPGPESGCVDTDKDGTGVGPGCKGVKDCDDSNADVHPGANEICGDSIDQNCNFTVDDGCPGVECKDGADGDGWGIGKDCVLPDCDDTSKTVHPFAAEVCGDNKDDNCDGIADDGCPGRQCENQDGDKHGVGKGCPGQQDCDDTDFSINPASKEVCGDGVDNDCNGVADDGCSGTVDNDGDGWGVGAVSPGPPDCNDSDPAVHPGAKETCGDKIDNNCNGSLDEGCPGVDCKDGDSDGWPAGNACQGPKDCDDGAPAVHPWAVETCDKADNNCNRSIDEGCPGVDCNDADHDGWPAGKACDKVADCDDGNAGMSGWMSEICADGKDNNCNGTIDDACPICEDADQDSYGIGPKCANWDCDDTDPKSHPGASEICDEKDNNCNASVDEQCQGGAGCGCGMSHSPVAAGGTMLLLLALLVGTARRRPQR